MKLSLGKRRYEWGKIHDFILCIKKIVSYYPHAEAKDVCTFCKVNNFALLCKIIDFAEVLMKKKIDEIIIQGKKYRDPDYSAQKLADDLGISPFQLARLLKKEYGMAYSDIVLQLRVNEAKKHLLDPRKTNLQIEEIGLMVGFKNKVSFFQAFRKYEGGTPGKFRRIS